MHLSLVPLNALPSGARLFQQPRDAYCQTCGSSVDASGKIKIGLVSEMDIGESGR